MADKKNNTPIRTTKENHRKQTGHRERTGKRSSKERGQKEQGAGQQKNPN